MKAADIIKLFNSGHYKVTIQINEYTLSYLSWRDDIFMNHERAPEKGDVFSDIKTAARVFARKFAYAKKRYAKLGLNSIPYQIKYYREGEANYPYKVVDHEVKL